MQRLYVACRLCTRIRVFFALLKENETLTDQLAFQINKWCVQCLTCLRMARFGAGPAADEMQWDVCQHKMAPAAAELSCGVIAVTMR
jgi:hypothetical protein